MPAHCRLTGARPGFGKKMSLSHRRTPRRFNPNIQTKRYWLPGEPRHVRLRLSARAIKTIDKIGVEAAVARPAPAARHEAAGRREPEYQAARAYWRRQGPPSGIPGS